jgi:UDP-glucose 4-epimerase
MVERALRAYDVAHGLKFVSLRYFNACGATAKHGEHHDPETHLIPLALAAAQGKIPNVSIFGDDYPTPDGTAIRDYIHVSDLSQAHLLALEHLSSGKVSEFINLGNGNGYSVKEVIEAARKVTGRPIEAIVAPKRPGDPSKLIANSEKARKVLGWDPQYPRSTPSSKAPGSGIKRIQTAINDTGHVERTTTIPSITTLGRRELALVRTAAARYLP